MKLWAIFETLDPMRQEPIRGSGVSGDCRHGLMKPRPFVLTAVWWNHTSRSVMRSPPLSRPAIRIPKYIHSAIR